MKNVARWTAFTAATTLVWLVGGFCYLVLSRLYEAFQLPTIMLIALFAASAGTALATISFAARLEEDDDAADVRSRRLGARLPSFGRRQR